MANRYENDRYERENRQQGGYYRDDYQNEQFSQPQTQPGESYQADYDNGGFRDDYRGGSSRQGFAGRNQGRSGSRSYDPLEAYDRDGRSGEGRASSSYGDNDRSRNFDRQFGGGHQDGGYGAGSARGYRRSQSRSGNYGGGNYGGGNERQHRDDDRGFFDRAGDEVASWFGDEEAERRREMDYRRDHGRGRYEGYERGSDHRGRGPSNYKRSDERILEEACEHLTRDRGVDASNMEVTVQEGELTLDGKVNSRWEKRRAEDCVHDISGVNHVQNNLRIRETDMRTNSDRTDSDRTGSARTGDKTTGTLS